MYQQFLNISTPQKLYHLKDTNLNQALNEVVVTEEFLSISMDNLYCPSLMTSYMHATLWPPTPTTYHMVKCTISTETLPIIAFHIAIHHHTTAMLKFLIHADFKTTKKWISDLSLWFQRFMAERGKSSTQSLKHTEDQNTFEGMCIHPLYGIKQVHSNHAIWCNQLPEMSYLITAYFYHHTWINSHHLSYCNIWMNKRSGHSYMCVGIAFAHQTLHTVEYFSRQDWSCLCWHSIVISLTALTLLLHTQLAACVYGGVCVHVSQQLIPQAYSCCLGNDERCWRVVSAVCEGIRQLPWEPLSHSLSLDFTPFRLLNSWLLRPTRHIVFAILSFLGVAVI